ncbi:MAG: ABC transporter ATP-binding protein [Hyphomicrobiales bacterium]|nr:ABC transporter ATP-binding protein [Hyphomicrobiales bacterium]
MIEPPALAVDHLVAGYEPGLSIVNGASFSAAKGEMIALLGPNGAGKSTLLKAVAGLIPIESGSVRLGERDITRLPAHRMIEAGIAFAPQTENVFLSMSVDDNLRLAAGALHRATRRTRVEAIYDAFPDLARQRALIAGRLSGGQRQMLAIARALLVGPAVLMLDEPSAGLAPRAVEAVFAKLMQIRSSGVTIVLVEQNARGALSAADRAYILVQGRNRHEGPARALIADAAISTLYLGGFETEGEAQ